MEYIVTVRRTAERHENAELKGIITVGTKFQFKNSEYKIKEIIIDTEKELTELKCTNITFNKSDTDITVTYR